MASPGGVRGEPRAPWHRRTRWTAAGVLALAAAYAGLAATTTPFTWAADAVTALPLAASVVAAVWRWPLRPVPAAGAGPRACVAWVALIAAVLAFELADYLAPGPRGAHPTLSSMADAVDRHTAPKAVAFLAWMALGAYIVRAGTSGRGTTPPPP